MHFLLSTFGSSGDVFPMFGLALELRRRGHRVTFATNAHYAGLAARHDLPFEALGTEEEFAACVNHSDLWHPQRAFAHVFRFLQPALARQFKIHAECAAAGDTVAIANVFSFGALLAQEKHALPVITMHCQPAVMWSDHQPPRMAGLGGPRWWQRIMFRVGERFFLDPVVLPYLNSWRGELGLPPVRKIVRWWNSPYGVLCMFPDWYAPPQPDWPRPLMQTDFPLWNDRPNEALDPAVAAFLAAGDPPLVFTPGSANLHGRPFFVAAVEACHSLGRRGVLLSEFPEQIPADLPESVAYFRYVPLDLLLREAAAFVHHGGIGSTSQAMLAGVPQVIMPLAHDQFDNAQRVKKLGLGDALAPHKFTGPRLVELLKRLLSQPSVAQASRQAAGRLAARDGLTRSADAIEHHVAQGLAVAR